MRIRHGRGRPYPRAMAGAASWVIAGLLATAALPAATAPAAAGVDTTSATLGQQIAVPAYFYPAGDGGALWGRLNDAGIAVANPFSGPGKTRDPNYAVAIAAARDAGVTVLGYVATGYLGTTGRATRLGETTQLAWFSQVQQDIETWYRLYGTDGLGGIFFDEVQNVCSYARAYRELSEHTKRWHRGAFTAINPGIDTESCYADIGDVMLTFEGTYGSYLDWEPPAWHRNVDPRRLWHLVHATSTQDQLAHAMRLSKQRRAGYVYVTPDVLANPWDTLPPESYWRAQLDAAQGSGGPAPSLFTGPVPVRVGSTEATLAWLPATGRVAGYDVLVDGVRVAGTIGALPLVTLRGLEPAHRYRVSVVAHGESGNVSAPSRSTPITTKPADGSPPAAPIGLRAVETKVASVRVAWEPVTDAVAYDVHVDGSPLLSLPSWLIAPDTGNPISGLEPGTTYTIAVYARDTSGNRSPAADTLTVTTAMPSGDPITDAFGSLGASHATYRAQFNLPFDFHHVFIDVDNDAATGFGVGGVGADLLIENGWLYRHTGTGWNWLPVEGPSPLVSSDDGLFVWQVPNSVLGEPVREHRAVFHGAGSSPDAFSAVIIVREAR